MCLLDIKRLVCDFAGAVIDQSQFQAAKRWRAEFIFDPSDLHKLLVLKVGLTIEGITFTSTFKCGSKETLVPHQTSSVRISQAPFSYAELHFLPRLFLQVDGVQIIPAHGFDVSLVSLSKVDHLIRKPESVR